jgi:23S rRNA (cytidine2498-2'-O)-methyltransferase
MKKRFDEVQQCRAIISENLAKARVPFLLRFKQLYHDREEVTGFLEHTDQRRRAS